MDAAGHNVTDGASFLFIIRVGQAWKSYVVLIFYRLTGTGYCLRIINISTASFAICHKIAKIALNVL
jgi:hypothetical protein